MLDTWLEVSGKRVELSFILPPNLQSKKNGDEERGSPGTVILVDTQPECGPAAKLKMEETNGWFVVKRFEMKVEKTKKHKAYQEWMTSVQCGVQGDCIYRVDDELKNKNDMVL
jgi:hypothetical protein